MVLVEVVEVVFAVVVGSGVVGSVVVGSVDGGSVVVGSSAVEAAAPVVALSEVVSPGVVSPGVAPWVAVVESVHAASKRTTPQRIDRIDRIVSPARLACKREACASRSVCSGPPR